MSFTKHAEYKPCFIVIVTKRRLDNILDYELYLDNNLDRFIHAAEWQL
jgi:hypothetical protein